MDWFDIRNNGQVKVIREQVYRGILCTWVESGGWKITLGMEEYVFPNFQEAKYAIDRIHESLEKDFWGVKLKIQKGK